MLRAIFGVRTGITAGCRLLSADAAPAAASLSDNKNFFVRCSGLPYNAKENDVSEFLGGKGIKRVQLAKASYGRHSGEAIIECEDEDCFKTALRKSHQHMGDRFVIVSKCSPRDMHVAASMKGYVPSSTDHNIPNSDHIVRLHELPYECTKDEVEKFMGGLNIVPDGIIFPHERLGQRSTGIAYVMFNDASSAAKALERGGQNIKDRSIKVYASTRETLIRSLDGLSIKMIGINFNASEADIYDFFAPLQLTFIEVKKGKGRRTGEARVGFTTKQDYDEALLKNKHNIGTRYVTLFPYH